MRVSHKVKNWFRASLSWVIVLAIGLPLHSFPTNNVHLLPIPVPHYEDQALVQPTLASLNPIIASSKIKTTHLVVTMFSSDRWLTHLALLQLLLPVLPHFMSGSGALPPLLLGNTFAQSPLPGMQNSWIELCERGVEKPNYLWETVQSFINRFFGVGEAVAPQSSLDKEHTLALQKIEVEFLSWLNTLPEESKYSVPNAVLGIQLNSIRHLLQLEDARPAFRTLEENQATEVLLSILLHKGGHDFIHVAAALDSLENLKAMQTIDEFTFFSETNMELTHFSAFNTPETMILLPVLARQQQTRGPAERSRIVTNLKNLLGLDREHAAVAYDLLTLENVPRESLAAFLQALISRNEKRDPATTKSPYVAVDSNLYIMVTMLAILNFAWHLPTARVSLSPSRLADLQKEITHTHWNAPNNDLVARTASVSRIAGALGEMIAAFDEKDPAIQVMMGFLFDMVFRDEMYLQDESRLHPATYSKRDIELMGQTSIDLEDPRKAGRLQFSVFNHALVDRDTEPIRWAPIYESMATYLSNRETSLSRTGLVFFHRFIHPGHVISTKETERARNQRRDELEDSWRVYVPEDMLPNQALEKRPLLQTPDVGWRNYSERQLLKQLEEYFAPVISSLDHWERIKYEALVLELPNLIRMVKNQPLLHRIYPYYLEVDPTHFCNNRCRFCRYEKKLDTGLRPVPEKEDYLSADDMIQVTSQLHRLNRRLYVRISGLIGEPLLNPATIEFMRFMNNRGIPYGMTTNGLLFEDRWGQALDAAFAPDSTETYKHFSLDAPDDPIYADLKQPVGDYAIRPFTRVKNNILWLNERRKKFVSDHLDRIPMKIAVSALVQEENYAYIKDMAVELRDTGIDAFQIKFQHHDPRRKMDPDHIRQVFRDKQFMDRLQTPAYSISFLQNEEEALRKNEGPLYGGATPVVLYDSNRQPRLDTMVSMIPANVQRCIMQHFAPSLVPTRFLERCCQNYLRTLRAYGDTRNANLQEMLDSPEAQAEEIKDPRKHCLECSPSDAFGNAYYAYLQAVDQYPGLTEVVVKILYDLLHLMRLRDTEEAQERRARLLRNA